MAHQAQSIRNYPILLEGIFPLHPKTSPVYRVTVTAQELRYAPNTTSDSGSASKKTAPHVVKFSDVIGCDCMRGKPENCISIFLNVYAYPHSKKFASKVTLRKRQVVTLVFSHFTSYEENHREATRWQLVLQHLIQKIEIRSPQDIGTLTDLPDRKLLVLVNPFSGPGKALVIFQQRIVPMLAEAGFQYHLIVTEYAGHGRELAKSTKLDDWYGIVIVSGDGLIFEVINGLMDRPDWEKAIRIPVGCLPGGSGNALACSLAYRAGEPFLEKVVLHTTFMLTKHSVVPMDLVAVDLCSGKRLYSFLAIAWGIIADVDIESERFRSLGNSRFAIGAVIRIVGLRKYHGRVSFLPIDGKYKGTRHSSIAQDTVASTHDAASDDVFARSLSMNDAITKVTLSSSGGAECTGNAASATPLVTPDGKVRTDLLPPLDSPVPHDWVTIEDDFTLVGAIYQTHLAQDMIPAPESRLNDGVIFLHLTRATVTRVRLLKLFSAMQEGLPLDDPSSEIIRVRAFRLEPLNGTTGTLTVDGEVVDYGPIQAQVLPSLGRIMTLTKDD